MAASVQISRNSVTESDPKVVRIGGTAVERPPDEKFIGPPVALRSAQHITVSQGRFGAPWSKRLILIKWVIKGECEMRIGAERIVFGPGQVAVYLPTQPHRFWALSEVNELVWFSVDGPLSELFMRELDLQIGVYRYGPAPVDQIHKLMESLKDHSIQGRRYASILAMETIYAVANATRLTSAPAAVQQVKCIIQDEFADLNFSTEAIAAKIGYHRGSLSRMFHQHTGITIMEYLTQVRLQEAIALLRHTDDKVAQICRTCGFREPTYFCRWLRKHTGMAPSDLRKSTELLPLSTAQQPVSAIDE